jgi:hypothetical protein
MTATSQIVCGQGLAKQMGEAPKSPVLSDVRAALRVHFSAHEQLLRVVRLIFESEVHSVPPTNRLG